MVRQALSQLPDARAPQWAQEPVDFIRAPMRQRAGMETALGQQLTGRLRRATGSILQTSIYYLNCYNHLGKGVVHHYFDEEDTRAQRG